MDQVTEQSVVSADNYASIKEMMLSNDEASVNVALTILEQSNYEKSEVYLMCILKDCFRDAFGTAAKFKEVAPALAEKVTERLHKDDLDISKLSFKEIYELALKRNVPEEIEFTLTILRDELVELLKEFGYGFVDFTEVLIKPMGWSESQKKLIESLKEGAVNA
jgi:hypothetical protein